VGSVEKSDSKLHSLVSFNYCYYVSQWCN